MTRGVNQGLLAAIVAAGFLTSSRVEAQTVVVTTQAGNGAYADGHVGRGHLNGMPNGDTLGVNGSILVGDSAAQPFNDTFFRGFLGFNTSDLSALGGASITSIKLRLYTHQDADAGGDIGSVLVDLVDFGSFIDTSDYDLSPITANIGSLPATGTGYHEVDVTEAALSSVLAGKVQFRLRAEFEQFQTGQNIVWYEDADQSGQGGIGVTGSVPQLVIRTAADVVPEPTAVALFLPALGVVLVSRRRKQPTP